MPQATNRRDPPEERRSVVLSQRVGDDVASFTLHADRLDYEYREASTSPIRRTVPWGQVPRSIHLQTVLYRNARAFRLARLTGLVLVLIVAFRLPGAAIPAVYAAGYGILSVVLTVVFSRFHRKALFLLPTEAGDLILLDDENRPSVVRELMAARAQYFRNLPPDPSELTPRQRLLRLRWLTVVGVVEREEFESEQAAALPGLANSLFRRPCVTRPDRRFVQTGLNTRFVFEFHADHLALARRNGEGREFRCQVPYGAVPPDGETRPDTFDPDPFPRLVCRAFLIAAAGIFVSVALILPATGFSGPGGTIAFLSLFGPAAALSMIGWTFTTRWVSPPAQIFVPGIVALDDSQRPEIVRELQERRDLILKQEAEPDPLLTARGQEAVLERLAVLGVVRRDEIPERMNRAAAMRTHLGFDDEAGDEAEAALLEEWLPDPAPTVTLH